MNHYEVLGLGTSATSEQIKTAWRKKSFEVHPDREGGSHEAMAAVNKAYEILMDPERRKAYDEDGQELPVASQDVKARQSLIVAFSTVLVHDEGDSDLIKRSDEHISKEILSLRDQLNDYKANSQRMKAKLKRLKFKGKPEANFLTSTIEQQIAMLDAAIQKAEDNILVLARAREILTDYSYEMPPSYGQWSHSPWHNSGQPGMKNLGLPNPGEYWKEGQ